MTNQPLSPAAQAILHKFWDAPVSPSRNLQIAAVLQAVADEVVPAGGSRKNNEIRSELLAISDELDSTNNTSQEDYEG